MPTTNKTVESNNNKGLCDFTVIGTHLAVSAGNLRVGAANAQAHKQPVRKPNEPTTNSVYEKYETPKRVTRENRYIEVQFLCVYATK